MTIKESAKTPEKETQTAMAASAPAKIQPFFDKTMVAIFAALFFLTVMVLGGIYVSQQAFKVVKELQVCECPSPVCSPVPPNQPSPAASASANLRKTDLQIKVLNGSGIAGSAGKMVAYLQELGYTHIETGNAEDQNYLRTEVQIKASKEPYLAGLIEDIEKKYASVSAKISLPEESQNDVMIIVAK